MVEKNHKHKLKGGKTDTEFYVQVSIIAVLLLAIMFSLGKISSGSENGVATGVGSVSASDVIPSGVPEVYGSSLGVSYDDVTPENPRLADATIRKLSEYEDLDLTEEQMQRYIAVAGSISCEYCCGAKSIIFENGQRACGCAHSYAMRGLAKYLLINHPDMSDEDILSELGKWKVLFFPGIHEGKAEVLESQGIDSTDYINLASNMYRGIEKDSGTSGGMVGGC